MNQLDLFILLTAFLFTQEKVTDPLSKSVSHAVNCTNGPPYAQSMLSMENDDGISCTGWSYSCHSNEETSPRVIVMTQLCTPMYLNLTGYTDSVKIQNFHSR